MKLNGYKEFSKPRKRRKNARRDSGGLVFYVKEFLLGGISECNWVFEDGLVFKLCKTFFGFTDDVYILFPYMRSASSSRNVIDDGIDVYDILVNKIAELSIDNDIIVIGDMNGRTAELEDLTLIGDINEFDDRIEKVVTHENLIINNMSVNRTNEDKTINDYGIRLIRLCKMCDLILCNGRVGEDKQCGKLTYCEKKGKSCIDYALVSKGMLKYVKNFKVGTFNAFSDHAPIFLELVCKTSTVNDDSFNYEDPANVRMKWKEERKEEYLTKLHSEENITHFQSIYDRLDNDVLSNDIIDECVNELSNIILSAGENHNICVKRAHPSTKKNSWYDNECREKLESFRIAERLYRLSNSEIDRVSMSNLRSSYRKCCRKKRQIKKVQEAQKLVNLSRSDPRGFWRKTKAKRNFVLPTCDFHTYFQQLYEINSFLGNDAEEEIREWEEREVVEENDFLDSQINLDELEIAIKKLKTDKAAGCDGILNEFICNSSYNLKLIMLKLFNSILNTGQFPKLWVEAEIVPIFKKGDRENPENYRGITLISCIGKVFTSIINRRLNTWAESNNVYSDNQFGFREGRGAVDCMFILHGIIESFLSQSKPLYCVFVDLKRAFDSANRRALWFKLHKNNVSSKIINLLQNMYDKIKLRVKQSFNKNQESSDVNFTCFFASKAGVLQGESLSPFLFSMFLNDLNDYLKEGNDVGIKLSDWILAVLLFADDMVILSESRVGLQNGLNSLSKYCDKWGLEVNINKTKCVPFKKGGRIGKLDNWFYKNQHLETVKQFKYLGLVFGSSGKFAKCIQNLVDQGNRALFCLKQIIHNNSEIMPNTQLILYNSLVVPVISYGCEIWGFIEADPLEKIHLSFLKSILGVKKSTPSCSVYKELNVTKLQCSRLTRILKFWLKVIKLPNNDPVKIIYDLLLKDATENNMDNWASLVRDMLTTRGFGNVWVNQFVNNENSFVSEFKQRVQDNFFQENNNLIRNLSDNRLYKHLAFHNEEIGMSSYLTEIKEKYLRTAVTKLILGSHNFMVERGKWVLPKRDYLDRLCNACQVVEDEYHVVIECKRFDELRKKYIPMKLTDSPSMYNFIQFLNNCRGNELRNFSIFCCKILINYRDVVLLQ